MSNRLTYFPIKMFSSKRGYMGDIGGARGVYEKSLREGWTVGQVGHLSPHLSHQQRTRYGAVTGPAGYRL